MRWWCTACGGWREVRSLGSVGMVCAHPGCGSGRVRPPAPGEAPPELPPVSPQQVREELDR